MSGTTGSSTPTFRSQTSNVTPVPDEVQTQLYAAALESSFRNSGAGSFTSMWQTILSRIDRFGYNPMPPNHEVAGLTFITKPKLNLMTSSLRQDRIMTTLDTVDPISLPFSIRCYLDSRLSQGNFQGGQAYKDFAAKCPFFNSDLPFIIPLTNCLQSITGFPDFNIDVESMEGGFFGEDQTFAAGSDMNKKSFDLSLTFRDIQGGYIMALFIYWTRYIALVKLGLMLAYPEDIYERRINYTCSIYRLILDPSRRYVVKWAKATGCFPKSVPIGNIFNIAERENYLHASSQFTIPFQANKVEYMDPINFREFNSIITKYAGTNWAANRSVSPVAANSNFAGIPHINTKPGGLNELQFWCLPEELADPFQTTLSSIKNQVGSLLNNNASGGGSIAIA